MPCSSCCVFGDLPGRLETFSRHRRSSSARFVIKNSCIIVFLASGPAQIIEGFLREGIRIDSVNGLTPDGAQDGCLVL